MKIRIKRDFRQQASAPTKFLNTVQNVKRGLTDNANYPDSAWGTHLSLRQQLFEYEGRVGKACHLASAGDRNHIRVRDQIIQEGITMLDEIASFLESISARNPDALYTTGFSITQERRSTPRTKQQLTATGDFNVVNSPQQGQAVGSGSPQAAAYNHEIHINQKDPTVESDWYHAAIFPDVTNMVINNLSPGHTFFRERPHGPNGPGPWSAIVSTTIT